MKPARRALFAAGLALCGAGCAYFNGMYNANRFARQAAGSERAGRIGEARDRWQTAAMHAESLVARHPTSRWVVDAQLVRGRALVHLGYWSDAVPVLEDAARRAVRPEQRYEALALLGEADLAIQRYPEAMQALDTALGTGQRALRAEVLLTRGRVRRRLGQPDSAIADLRSSSEAHAPYDLAAAELATGDTAGAGALYDSLARQRPYVESDWRPALDSLAATGALAHAAALAGTLAARRDLSAGQQARLLLDDGLRRLAARDTAAATERFTAALDIARDSLEGGAAGVKLAQLAIAAAASDSDLAAQRVRLRSLVMLGGSAAQDAQDVLRYVALVDTLGAATSAPDAWWFQRAEVLRDSLHAGRLAAVDFAEMAQLFPASPWSAKALIAAIAAAHPAADSLRAILAERYGRSPYTLAAAGDTAGAQAFSALEDSLRQTLARGAAVRGAPGEDRGRRGDLQGDEPSGRRRPADTPAQRPGRPGEQPGRPRPDSPSPRLE